MSGLSMPGAGNVAVTGAAAGAVELSETGGRALKLQTDTPHLVSLGGGRLSTAVTLHPIPQGRVTLGNGPKVDIPVLGTGVQALHCHIENCSGVVTLYPLAEQISLDGIKVTSPTRLSQGVMLTIGRSNYMRFNHPAEAKLMKSVLPNSRISMAPIIFEAPQETYNKINKKPPVAPRRSPRESYAEFPEESNCIMNKVSKFEYLAAQNYQKSLSPKVFSANAVTVNTPAKDVLGKAPPNLQNFTKNLHQPAVNYSDTSTNKNKTPDRQVFGVKSPAYVNVTINDTKNCNNRVIINENGCIPKNQNLYVNVSVEPEIKNLNNKQFGSSLRNNGAGMLPRISTPSPCFNRNPSPYCRSVTPNSTYDKCLEHCTESVGELSKQKSVSSSIEDLSNRKNEAEQKRNQAHVERVKEQEEEKAEQARLEEILNMCAEYERQVQWEKNNKPTPNRIITNGSLPRDKRQCTSPSQTTDEQTFHFESSDCSPKDTVKMWNVKNNSSSYENVTINNYPQMHSSTPNAEKNGTILQYENIEISNLESGNCYENIILSSNGGASSPFPQSPRTRIKTYLTTNKESTPKDQFDTSDLKLNTYNTEGLKTPKSDETCDENKLCDALETPKRKLAQKFILPIQSKSLENKTNKSKFSDNSKLRVEKLKKEKKDILTVMVTVKRKISDIEIQEEELMRELEMEKALLNGEHKSKQLELTEDEKIKEKLILRAKQIELKMEQCRVTQSQHQEDCRKKLETAQNTVHRLEIEISKISKKSSSYPHLMEELAYAQEQLENERKAFEDLEFHHLEEEADWLASREEIQREILDLSQKIEINKSHILDLNTQKVETLDHTTQESKSLERQLITCLRKLEDCRNRLSEIDTELQTYTEKDSENELSSDSETDKHIHRDVNIVNNFLDNKKNNQSSKKSDDTLNMSQSFNEKLLRDKSILDIEAFVGNKCPSQDDIDRISKVTSNAPINMEDGRGSLGRKTIESLKEIERNRQLHLKQQGSQVIEHERRRVLALKQRAQDEVRTQWAQNRHKDCSSLNSTGSEETHLDSVSGSDEMDKQSSNRIGSGIEQSQQDIVKLRTGSEGPDSPRPMSESSEMSCDTGVSGDLASSPGPGGTLPRRTRSCSEKGSRPLTRYLPIRSAELDLRKHIETAGHQIDLCPHVMLNSTTCRGFLHKMGSKLHGWGRRWFVFDRTKHTLVYYSDKSERKPRGGAYFQAIEEVYLDHQNAIKSPNPHLTFIIKTHERSYHLMAPTPEAMRIWIDVVFTGAEGYQEFEHGS